MESIREAIGQRLRAARDRRRISLQSLAQLMGLDPKTGAARLSNYENGLREADAATMLAIAHALGESPGFLMFGPETEQSYTDGQELSPSAMKLIKEIVAADRQGEVDAPGCEALTSMLSAYRTALRSLNDKKSNGSVKKQ